MRMSTDETRDEEVALETIAAAVEAGITVFDTARSYGHGEAELALSAAPAPMRARGS
jgi:aryl-alcohol dehydrogenase-like predicted oxidoreductase